MPPPPDAVAVGPIAFDYLLTAVAVIMTFRSRRFAPLAIVVAAAPLASLLMWVMGKLRWKGVAAAAAVVMAGLTILARHDILEYNPNNPLRLGKTVFDRMHLLPELFPVEVGRFFSDNHLGGNVYGAWEWEGYLRWACPRVKVFFGGRAQQIYNENDLAAHDRACDPQAGPGWLQQNQVHLVVLSPADATVMLPSLLAGGNWAIIFHDGLNAVLADRQSEGQLVPQTLEGELKYPSELIRAISRMLCLSTTSDNPADVFAAVKEANAVFPSTQAYFIAGILGQRESLRPDIIRYLEQEDSRLSQWPKTTTDRRKILLCRWQIQTTLAGLYHSDGRPYDAGQAQARSKAIDAELDAMKKAWGWE
jgi:hypothetical protein